MNLAKPKGRPKKNPRSKVVRVVVYLKPATLAWVRTMLRARSWDGSEGTWIAHELARQAGTL